MKNFKFFYLQFLLFLFCACSSHDQQPLEKETVFGLSETGELTVKKYAHPRNRNLMERILDTYRISGLMPKIDDLAKLEEMATAKQIPAINLFAWISMKTRSDNAAKVRSLLEFAEEKDAISTYLLGLLHFRSFGVKKDDFIKELYYFEKAFLMDAELLYSKLLWVYRASLVDGSDGHSAFAKTNYDTVLSIAKQKEIPYAWTLLYNLTMRGYGCTKDENGALVFLEKAVSKEEPHALYLYAHQLARREGNSLNATTYLRKAKEMHYLPAQTSLSILLYLDGKLRESEKLRIEPLNHFDELALMFQAKTCLDLSKKHEAAVLLLLKRYVFNILPDKMNEEEAWNELMKDREINKKEVGREVMSLLKKGSFGKDIHKFLNYQ
jgi:TPR repeat protein